MYHRQHTEVMATSENAKSLAVPLLNVRPPQISIAMCTYNGARFLAEQLESIGKQTQQPDELIVCDDGSKDKTVAIIDDFSRTAGFPVRLVCNCETLGPAKNFEKAIQLCRGQIIFLSDQDDVWQPQKVKKLVAALAAHPEALYAFSNAQTINQRGELLEQTLWDTLVFQPTDFAEPRQLMRLLKGNVVTGAGMAFRAQLCATALPVPRGWMHDGWLALVGSVISDGIPVPEMLYKYRSHDTQVCGCGKRPFFKILQTSLSSDEESSREKLRAFQALVERLADPNLAIKPTSERLNILKQKELHLLRRTTVRSVGGFSRIGKVLVEAFSGRYGRFSNSYYSIIRDLYGR